MQRIIFSPEGRIHIYGEDIFKLNNSQALTPVNEDVPIEIDNFNQTTTNLPNYKQNTNLPKDFDKEYPYNDYDN